jgi:hypothetical protein
MSAFGAAPTGLEPVGGAKLEQSGAVELTKATLPPAGAAQLAQFEKKCGALDAHTRAFLMCGLKGYQGTIEEPSFVSLGLDFMRLKSIERATDQLRELASANEGDAEHFHVLSTGIPLTFEEPQIVVVDGAVFHYSIRNPVKQVSASLLENPYLQHAEGFDRIVEP